MSENFETKIKVVKQILKKVWLGLFKEPLHTSLLESRTFLRQ